MIREFTTTIYKEDNAYVSFCPELDIASQGSDIEKAKNNLKEAAELFFECASKEEVTQRYFGETYIPSIGVGFGL